MNSISKATRPVPGYGGSQSPAAIFRRCFIGPALIILPVLTTTAAARSRQFTAKEFGSVMVLENGRLKPFDTYARNKLLQYSGKRRISGSSAIEWMCRLIFAPQRCDFDKVFLINNPEVAQTLGITPERKRRYSYAAVSRAAESIQKYYDAAQKKPKNELSPFDREIIRIYNDLIDYRSIASTFSFLQPNPDFHLEPADSVLPADIPRILLNPHQPPSFYDMLSLHSFLGERMAQIRKTGTDSLSSVDRSILMIARMMFSISNSVENAPPTIIPVAVQGTVTWYSPWKLIASRRRSGTALPAMQTLLKIHDAFQSGNQQEFNTLTAAFNKTVRSTCPGGEVPDPATELLYNRLDTFFIAKILLGVSAIFALVALFSASRAVGVACSIGVGAAWLLCTIGITLRMIIMGHPPVTNLYETFIFVAWTTIIIGMVLEFIRIRPIGLLTASLAGFIFIHVAGRYAADGDTLGMLAAVLDSGFWLTTHIITISLGYAGCLGAGFIGHIYLIQKLLTPQKTGQLKKVSSAVYGVLAFGLLFTVIGTVTGGMWADQAWGRFWGWDPKENGALLIILWTMIVFHGRIGKMIGDTGMAAGAIISAVVVLCTWIGVNLLGTGLHSYGFTSSGAKILFGDMGFEVLFLGTFALLQAVRKQPAAAGSKGKRK